MELSELIRGKHDCACGKDHTCPIEFLEIGEGAIEKIPVLCKKYRSIVVVCDENTRHAAGDGRIEELLGEKVENRMIFSGKSLVVPDESSIAAIEEKMSEKTDLLLGIGSGVINDLCKYTSDKHGIAYYIVATAPSMDGYASKGAAMILGGMKVTTNAKVPHAIIADSSVLKDAPIDMIRAGYGDIVGKFSCLNDWKLSSVVNGEYFCDYVYDATMQTTVETAALAEALNRREPEALEKLMKALVTVGVLMAYVGNSRPASGSEHHLAHFFEIVGIVKNEPYFAHGVDVVYAAVDTTRMREKLLTIEDITKVGHKHDPARYEKDILAAYGKVGPEVLALQKKQGWYEIDRLPVYREKWDDIKSVLRLAPTEKEMLAYLDRIGLPYETYVAQYGEDKLKTAYRYAKDLKDRYSVLWMNYDLLG